MRKIFTWIGDAVCVSQTLVNLPVTERSQEKLTDTKVT